MTEQELHVRQTSGNKARNVATYWGLNEPLPGKVDRLYVVVGSTLKGYFEAHQQWEDTVAMWSETWRGVEPLEVRSFRGWLPFSDFSELEKSKKSERKGRVKAEEPQIEEPQTEPEPPDSPSFDKVAESLKVTSELTSEEFSEEFLDFSLGEGY